MILHHTHVVRRQKVDPHGPVSGFHMLYPVIRWYLELAFELLRDRRTTPAKNGHPRRITVTPQERPGFLLDHVFVQTADQNFLNPRDAKHHVTVRQSHNN